MTRCSATPRCQRHAPRPTAWETVRRYFAGVFTCWPLATRADSGMSKTLKRSRLRIPQRTALIEAKEIVGNSARRSPSVRGLLRLDVYPLDSTNILAVKQCSKPTCDSRCSNRKPRLEYLLKVELLTEIRFKFAVRAKTYSPWVGRRWQNGAFSQFLRWIVLRIRSSKTSLWCDAFR